MLNRDNDRFVHAHIHTKNYSPETEAHALSHPNRRRIREGLEKNTTAEPVQEQNRKEKKRKS
jgi:hypothetical protein